MDLRYTATLGCPRKSETSQTEKFLWAIRFSHYLGQKYYRIAKKIDFFLILRPN